MLQILYNAVLYLNEKTENIEDLKINVKKAFNSINDENNSFEHLGFRNIQIWGVKFEFNELVDLLYKKIYTNEILQIASDSVDDVLFSINSVKDGIKNNVLFGPITKEEGLQRFRSQFDVDDVLKKMGDYKSFIFIDVDTYIKSDTDVGKLDLLIQKNLDIVNSYIDYIIK